MQSTDGNSEDTPDKAFSELFELFSKPTNRQQKSTDPGLSAAERKTLRSHEAQEAITDREKAQKAFRERLREERRRREAAAGPTLYPAPELPDGTLIKNVRFSTRIRKALNAEGMKTIGEIREASDAKLLSLPDWGRVRRPSAPDAGPDLSCRPSTKITRGNPKVG